MGFEEDLLTLLMGFCHLLPIDIWRNIFEYTDDYSILLSTIQGIVKWCPSKFRNGILRALKNGHTDINELYWFFRRNYLFMCLKIDKYGHTNIRELNEIKDSASSLFRYRSMYYRPWEEGGDVFISKILQILRNKKSSLSSNYFFYPLYYDYLDFLSYSRDIFNEVAIECYIAFTQINKIEDKKKQLTYSNSNNYFSGNNYLNGKKPKNYFRGKSRQKNYKKR
jgi:hypothetical protein